MNVVIKQRLHDIHASIEDRPAIWASGKNPREALGNLVVNHPAEFNITVIYSKEVPKKE